MKFLFILFFSLLFFSCENQKEEKELILKGVITNQPVNEGIDHKQKVGNLKLEQVYAKLLKNDSVHIIVEGVITNICQKDGCWILIKFNGEKELFMLLDHSNIDVKGLIVGESLLMTGYMLSKELTNKMSKHITMHGGVAKVNEITKKMLLFKVNSVEQSAYF